MTRDGDPQRAGMRVEARIFMGIAGFLALATVVYWLTSREDAGTTMLLLAAAMALSVGGYLAVQSRKHTDPAGDGDHGDGQVEPAADVEAYLPHASVWPFAMGMGLVVMANGLALGMWALVPGALLTGSSLYGYARQSRRRD
ncbi:MAG: cytochrome c oxidase subunit 4 [Actinobacteria bacterium]|nr:cytochrome c oxidase subunit 4 [Actinomycetota bacterium]MBW3642309.1 cytochrome c oxidase subunit 4 [Actinomycetota bacterium]